MKWIKVKDNLPEYKQLVQLYFLNRDNKWVIIQGYLDKDVYCFLDDKGYWDKIDKFIIYENGVCGTYCPIDQKINDKIINRITHWMPLPEPPK